MVMYRELVWDKESSHCVFFIVLKMEWYLSWMYK